MKEVSTMMKIEEMNNSIMGTFPNAIPCRTDSMGDFLAVESEMVDGVQTYVAIKISSLLAKDRSNRKAFDVNAAHETYVAHHQKLAEKAQQTKKTKTSDPAKEEAKNNREIALHEWLITNPGEHTANDIKTAMPEVYGDLLIMQVGTDLKHASERFGDIVCRTEKKKNYWSYNDRV
jgi:hypothetical protein